MKWHIITYPLVFALGWWVSDWTGTPVRPRLVAKGDVLAFGANLAHWPLPCLDRNDRHVALCADCDTGRTKTFCEVLTIKRNREEQDK